MIKPALLMLLVAATTTVSQRRFGRNPPQADNTGSWEGDILCTDERSCREFWRDFGLTYAEYYALARGRNPSQHRSGSSSQDRPGGSSDSSSSSSSSSEESSHRGRRSVDSEEENYSDDNDPYIDDYIEYYKGEDGKKPVDNLRSASLKSPNVENKKNHRNIRSLYNHKTRLGYNHITDHFVNRKHGGFGVTDPSSHETGNGMLGRDLTRPGYWRRRANRKYPLWLKRNGDCTETPGTEGIFERIKASTRKPCTKYSPWLSLCKRKETTKPTRRLPSTSSATSEPYVQFTSTRAEQQSTQSTSVPAQQQSSVSTSGPAQESSTTEFVVRPVIT